MDKEKNGKFVYNFSLRKFIYEQDANFINNDPDTFVFELCSKQEENVLHYTTRPKSSKGSLDNSLSKNYNNFSQKFINRRESNAIHSKSKTSSFTFLQKKKLPKI